MNDLISRQAAIDAILAVTGNSSVRELYEHVQEHELSDMWSGGVNAAIDIIIAVPAAQPERKKGSWNVIQGDIVVCSECGMLAPKSMTGCLLNRHLEPNRTNFCPNCGADMRGEHDERTD